MRKSGSGKNTAIVATIFPYEIVQVVTIEEVYNL